MAGKAIIGATLIDGTGKSAQVGSVVLVSGKRIEAVGSKGQLEVPPDYEKVNAEGLFLLPGMVDAHVHLAHPAFIPGPFKGSQETYLALIAAHNVRTALQNGITTLRSVCDGGHMDLALRSAVRSGQMLGSRLFVAGKGICMTGGHGSQMPGIMHEVDSEDEMRKAVREEVKADVDLIKLLTSHRSDHPELSQEEIIVGTREAHRLGKRVAIHAGNFTGTRMAAAAGVDSIEHGNFIDEKTADMMAEKGIYLVPTIWVYHFIAEKIEKMRQGGGEYPMDAEEWQATMHWSQRVVERYPETIRIIRERGIKVAAGTDNVFPGEPFAVLHREIEYLTRFGFSNMEAIEAATRVGAEVIGCEDEFGTVVIGKFADLIMVERDPLEDITALKDVKWVMKEGLVIPLSPEYERQPIHSKRM
ncbi:MAG: amidohydrolase family protein [Anaerolineaceae bacterium]|nr:amidohydrolase family protein [Anaerolineaceae bacterium]